MAIELPKTSTPQPSPNIVQIDTKPLVDSARAITAIGNELTTYALDQIKQDSIKRADAEWATYVKYDEKGRMIPPAEPPGLPGTTTRRRLEQNIGNAYVQSVKNDGIGQMREISARVGANIDAFNNDYGSWAKTRINNAPEWLRPQVQAEIETVRLWGNGEVQTQINKQNAQARVQSKNAAIQGLIASSRHSGEPLEPVEEKIRQAWALTPGATDEEKKLGADGDIRQLRAWRAGDSYVPGKGNDPVKYGLEHGREDPQLQTFITQQAERKESIYNQKLNEARHRHQIAQDELLKANIGDLIFKYGNALTDPLKRTQALHAGDREKEIGKVLENPGKMMDPQTQLTTINAISRFFGGLREEDERARQTLERQVEAQNRADFATIAREGANDQEKREAQQRIDARMTTPPANATPEQLNTYAWTVGAYNAWKGNVANQAITYVSNEQNRRIQAGEPILTFEQARLVYSSHVPGGHISPQGDAAIYQTMHAAQQLSTAQQAQAKRIMGEGVTRLITDSINAGGNYAAAAVADNQLEQIATDTTGTYDANDQHRAAVHLGNKRQQAQKQDLINFKNDLEAEKGLGKLPVDQFIAQTQSGVRLGAITQEEKFRWDAEYRNRNVEDTIVDSVRIKGAARQSSLPAGAIVRRGGPVLPFDPQRHEQMGPAVAQAIDTGIVSDQMVSAFNGFSKYLLPDADGKENPGLANIVGAFGDMMQGMATRGGTDQFLNMLDPAARNGLMKAMNSQGQYDLQALREAATAKANASGDSRDGRLEELNSFAKLQESFRNAANQLLPGILENNWVNNTGMLAASMWWDRWAAGARGPLKQKMDEGGVWSFDIGTMSKQDQQKSMDMFATFFKEAERNDPFTARDTALKRMIIAFAERGDFIPGPDGKPRFELDHFYGQFKQSAGKLGQTFTYATMQATVGALIQAEGGINALGGQGLDPTKLTFVRTETGTTNVVYNDPGGTGMMPFVIKHNITADYAKQGAARMYGDLVRGLKAGEIRGDTGDVAMGVMTQAVSAISRTLTNESIGGYFVRPIRDFLINATAAGQHQTVANALAAKTSPEGWAAKLIDAKILPANNKTAVDQAVTFWNTVQDPNDRMSFLLGSQDHRDRMYQRMITLPAYTNAPAP